jgi:hypothetical protein
VVTAGTDAEHSRVRALSLVASLTP